jgi:hypothetical protein
MSFGRKKNIKRGKCGRKRKIKGALKLKGKRTHHGAKRVSDQK